MSLTFNWKILSLALWSQKKWSSLKSLVNFLHDLYNYCSKSTSAAHSRMRTSASVSPRTASSNSAAAENTSVPQLHHRLLTHTTHRPNLLPPPTIPQPAKQASENSEDRNWPLGKKVVIWNRPVLSSFTATVLSSSPNKETLKTSQEQKAPPENSSIKKIKGRRKMYQGPAQVQTGLQRRRKRRGQAQIVKQKLFFFSRRQRTEDEDDPLF